MQQAARPRTIIDKIFDAHAIHEESGRTLLYVDRVIAADTALPAFKALEQSGRRIRRPGQALHIPDHFTPSSGRTLDDVADDEMRAFIGGTAAAARKAGVAAFALGDARRGIQHVVAT